MRADLARRLAIAGFVAVTAVLAIGAGFALWVGHNIKRASAPPPGPASYARSTNVRRADSTAIAWQATEFGALQRMAPWLIPAGQSMLDTCSVGGGAGGLFGGGAPVTYSCQRTETRYYVYGASPWRRRTQLEQALGQLGWENFVSQSTTAHSSAPIADAELIGARVSLPGKVTPIGKVSLQYSWDDRGSAFTPAGNLGDVPRVLASSSTRIDLQASGVTQAQISAHLSASHDHVLIVSINEYYASAG